MRSVLSVAEKPSVAKELAAIISKQQVDSLKRQGISPYNPVFDINSCLFQNHPAKMIITSVTGHMMELEFEAAYKGWNSCQPAELFDAPLNKTVKKESENIEKTLIREAKQCSILMLWLDCDLEGENIAYEVIKVCKQANPRIDVYRARFSALVERDILRTLKFPDRPNPRMNDAVDARQEIDLRIGAAFTRFQTLRLQNKFENVGNTVISFGPCQFPTLGFVVERSARIKAFRPENFWCITCSYEFDNPDKPGTKLNCNFNWERSRLYDRLACLVLYDACVEGGGSAVVTQCNERPTTRQRPVPLNTIEFQMRASRFLRMSSDVAMAVAEGLYQRGILSYPRTETNFFQEGIELLALVGDHRNHPDWGPYAANLVDNYHTRQQQQLQNRGNINSNSNAFLWPRAGGKDDQAHPPIHPTKCVSLQDLQSADERKVYDLVSRHFLACCSCDAKGSLSTVSIGVPDASGERFNTSGLMVLERNWLDVYSQYEQWHANKVPLLRVGDSFQLRSLLMTEGRTSPPQPISESELISTMDKNGIGTDATIATHITTIQAREYAVRNAQNQFEPTKLGLALVEGYNSMGYQLNKPQLRALIEADCQKIARGEANKEDVVKKCLQDMHRCFLVCAREAGKLDSAMEKHFSYLGAGEVDNFRVVQVGLSRCGVCREPMDLRMAGAAEEAAANTKRYLYCGPCKRSYVVPPRGELSAHTVHCAICSFQALTVRNAETGKEHTVCPKCFSDPPPPPDGLDGQSDFRCFTCANESCVLAQRTAGSEVDVSPCSAPRCPGSMRLKKNQKGYILACSVPTCKSIWWVPKFVRSATPAAQETCQVCLQTRNMTVHKILFRLNMSRAPHGVAPESTLCPCCDPLWATTGERPLPLPAVSTTAAGVTAAGVGGNVAGNAFTRVTPAVAIATNLAGTSASESDYAAALAGKKKKKPSLPANAGVGVGAAAWPSGSRDGSTYVPPSVAEETPMCACGVASKQLTVSKEGPNKGRKFFSCAKSREGGCQYFQWADAVQLPSSSFSGGGTPGQYPRPQQPSSSSSSSFVSNSAAAGGYIAAPAGTNTTSAHSSNQADGVCRCGEPASVLVTKKAGPNMGRQFYACRKPREAADRCDYFQWVA